jgi:hypothetical protein
MLGRGDCGCHPRLIFQEVRGWPPLQAVKPSLCRPRELTSFDLTSVVSMKVPRLGRHSRHLKADESGNCAEARGHIFKLDR